MERIAGGRPRDPPQHTSECRPCRDMLLAVCKKKDYDITVNALSLAQAKEGPSAGITILVGMVSALTKRPVRCDVAMTGEVTVLGKILPVGAVQEKVIAAAEAGIKRVYVPAENCIVPILFPIYTPFLFLFSILFPP